MKSIVIALCLFVIGCHGPLTRPMVDRLDDETQQRVGDVWEDMFTPADRLERTLLLDVILSAQLHQYGVDYLRLVSEKYVEDGRVVMEVSFDREAPEFDEFVVTYVDGDGYEVRRERFSRQDVEERIDFLYESYEVTDDMDPDLREELEMLAQEQEARHGEIQAVLAPLNEGDSTVDDVADQD